jgi:N-(2-amino-2-carboxyethyl)-L-glutamate synthase
MSRSAVHDSLASCVGHTPLVRLSRCFPDAAIEVIAKLEMLNPAGSMKDRPAQFIVEHGLRNGTLRPGMRLVESTSGNLGIALAMVSRLFDLRFTAVVDPKIATMNLRLLQTFGAEIEMVSKPDEAGGYLGTRLRRARELAEQSPDTVWINQYANELNWRAYYETAGAEITAALDEEVDYFVAAVSTSGSLMGVSRRLRERSPRLTVVGVDAAGSVVLGGSPGRRELPGYGASRVPEILDRSSIDRVVYVNDAEAARGCRRLVATEGILGGGSSGAVVAAIERLVPDLPRPSRIVTVLPDRGERYLDLVYDDAWLRHVAGCADSKEVAQLVRSFS